MCWGCRGLKNLQLELPLFGDKHFSGPMSVHPQTCFYAEVFAKTLLLIHVCFSGGCSDMAIGRRSRCESLGGSVLPLGSTKKPNVAVATENP